MVEDVVVMGSEVDFTHLQLVHYDRRSACGWVKLTLRWVQSDAQRFVVFIIVLALKLL